MEAGHRRGVHQPRPVEGGVEDPVQPGFVPQGDGGGNGRGGLVKGSVYALLELVGAQGGPVPGGNPVHRQDFRLPIAIGQQIYPLGGVVGSLFAVGPLRAFHPGPAGNPVAGFQRPPLLRAVGQGVRGEKTSVQPDGDGIPADGGGLGIGGHLAGEDGLLPNPALRRGPEQGRVRPGPSQRRYPAQAECQRPPGCLIPRIPGQRPFVPGLAQKDGGLPVPGPDGQPHRQRQPQQGGGCQKRRPVRLKIARPQAGGGEAAGKPCQLPHTAAPSLPALFLYFIHNGGPSQRGGGIF